MMTMLTKGFEGPCFPSVCECMCNNTKHAEETPTSVFMLWVLASSGLAGSCEKDDDDDVEDDGR